MCLSKRLVLTFLFPSSHTSVLVEHNIIFCNCINKHFLYLLNLGLLVGQLIPLMIVPGSGNSATLMLPNSEDPLLSSQPKDFVLKKRIQLNGVPVRLLSNNGLIELNGGNFTGLLVDANGELKLIQTSSSGCATKNFVLSNAQLVTTSSQEIGTKDGRVKVQKLTLAKAVPNQTATKIITTNRCKIVNEVRREECNDVFLSPTT